MSTEAVKLSCTKCNSDNHKFWGKEFTGVEMVKCRTCALTYVNPRPKADEIKNVYGEHYWERLKRTQINYKKLKNAFTYDYLSLIKAVEFYKKDEDPAILDIGFGEAGFLKVAKMSGFSNLTANDINDARSGELKRFDIPLILGDITTTDVGQYDIINAQHVLEHVLDPFEFLRAVKKSLKSEGLAHIVVPNSWGLVDKQKNLLSKLGLKKKPYKHLSSWHHIFFYERKTLRFVLEESGFEILYLGTRNNIKDKGFLYEMLHATLDRLKWNSHLEVVVRAKS